MSDTDEYADALVAKIIANPKDLTLQYELVSYAANILKGINEEFNKLGLGGKQERAEMLKELDDCNADVLAQIPKH